MRTILTVKFRYDFFLQKEIQFLEMLYFATVCEKHVKFIHQFLKNSLQNEH